MCKIRGIGVDLCGVERMEPLLESAFLTRYFTAEEAAYIRGKGKTAAQTMAGIWAAKEAALKALGTGLSIPPAEVEVTHGPQGQPAYLLHGRAAQHAAGGRLHLSISHEGGQAAAFCVWEAAD